MAPAPLLPASIKETPLTDKILAISDLQLQPRSD